MRNNFWAAANKKRRGVQYTQRLSKGAAMTSVIALWRQERGEFRASVNLFLSWLGQIMKDVKDKRWISDDESVNRGEKRRYIEQRKTSELNAQPNQSG